MSTREQPARVVLVGSSPSGSPLPVVVTGQPIEVESPAGSPLIVESTTVVDPTTYKRNVTPGTTEPAPGGNDGLDVGQYSVAALRIRTVGSPLYDLKIWTRDVAGGSQFIEAPCETRVGLTRDYTRLFNVVPITENISVQIVATTGQLFIEWSAG